MAQPIPTKYIKTIAARAARFPDGDSFEDVSTVRYIAIYNNATCCTVIPNDNDRLRPM